MDQNYEKALQAYRQSFTRLLWAMPIAHAAALLAAFQILGNVPDPDYAFRALRTPIICLGIGGSMGLAAILFTQFSLMDGMVFSHSLYRKARSEDQHSSSHFLRKAQRAASSGPLMEFVALVLNFGSLLGLVLAGYLAFQAVDGGRLQPAEPAMSPAEAVQAVTEIITAARSTSETP